MSRERTSPIWKASKEELEQVIAKSNTYAEVLHYFGLSEMTGGNYQTLKNRCKIEAIDLTALKQRSNEVGITHAKKIAGEKRAIPLEDILVENSTFARNHLKTRLIKNGIIENICDNCRLDPLWDGKELILVLDHINGVNNDNRIENLRLLCPNCNSQTSTFAGKRLKKFYYCIECNEKICKGGMSGYCNPCYRAKNAKVQNKPDKDSLQAMISTMSWVAIGQKYDVTDNAVKKWADNYNLEYPVRRSGILPDIACTTCGKKFHPKDQKTKYCSKDCMTTAQRKH